MILKPTTFLDRIGEIVGVAHRKEGPTATQTLVALGHGYYLGAAHMIGRNGIPFGIYHQRASSHAGDVAGMLVHPAYPITAKTLPAHKNDMAVCFVPMPRGGYTVKVMTQRPAWTTSSGILADWSNGLLHLHPVDIAPKDSSAVVTMRKPPLPVGASSSAVFVEGEDGEPVLVGIVSGGPKNRTEEKQGRCALAVCWEPLNRAFLEPLAAGDHWRLR